MAKTSVYDYSTTASSNSDFDGTDSSGATGKVKDGDNYARSIASHVKGFALDLGAANTVGGTGDAITVTLASNPTALVDGMRISINAPGTNTGAATIAVTNSGATLLGTPKIRKWASGAETALSAGDITSGHIINLVYDAARDSASGAFMIDGIAATVPYTAASSSGAASLQFAEDTDNGSNKVTLQGPASTADVTVTLPAEAGTVVVGSASSTDNNIPRFDGTLGKLQAGSGIAVSDTFAITASVAGGSEGTKYPGFFCRAWVVFNASSGTPTILSSGNVTSITDNGVGEYTINFTTAMPDANYAVLVSGTLDAADAPPLAGADWARFFYTNAATGSVSVGAVNAAGAAFVDAASFSVAIFR